MNRQTETEGGPPKRTFFLAYSFFQQTQILPLENHSLTFLTAAQPVEFRFGLPDRLGDLFLEALEILQLHVEGFLLCRRLARTSYVDFCFVSGPCVLPEVHVLFALDGLGCKPISELHSYPSLEITGAVAALEALTPIFPEVL
jgi:hypothetical protein